MSPLARNRWDVVVAYAALAAATQVLWLTFAPITTASAEHYGVSEGAIGWLAEIFPLLYVVLAIPAGMALDRWFVPVLRAGAALLAFVGFGVFIALTTWLQGLLEPFGVSDGTAGAMLAVAVVAGVATTTWLPAAAARRGAERTVLAVALLVCAVCCAALAAVRAPGAQFVLVAAIGAVVLPALPVLLELAERRAGPAGASAAALLWLAGNLGGIALALPVGALVHHAAPAFGLLALAALAGLPLAWRLRAPRGALRLDGAIAGAAVPE